MKVAVFFAALLAFACAQEVGLDYESMNALSEGLIDLMQAKKEQAYDDIAKCIQDLLAVEGDLQTTINDIKSLDISDAEKEIAKLLTEIPTCIADCKAATEAAKSFQEIGSLSGCIGDVEKAVTDVEKTVTDV